MTRLEREKRHLKEAAQRNRKKAEKASTTALREFYQGRADAFSQAASALSKIIYSNKSDEHTRQR